MQYQKREDGLSRYMSYNNKPLLSRNDIVNAFVKNFQQAFSSPIAVPTSTLE